MGAVFYSSEPKETSRESLRDEDQRGEVQGGAPTAPVQQCNTPVVATTHHIQKQPHNPPDTNAHQKHENKLRSKNDVAKNEIGRECVRACVLVPG